MKGLKRFMVREGGFTLVEMTVVVAIIAVLAALALPAVTGVTTSTRSASKIGDQKSVQEASVRYADGNGGSLPSSTTPTTAVTDQSPFDGVIKIHVDSSSGSTGTPPTFDVVCSGVTATLAIDACFGGIDFSNLVPTYMSVAPKHQTETVVATASNTPDGNLTGDGDIATPDFFVDNCDLAGNTCQFYMDDNDSFASLDVWNVDSNNSVFTFKADNIYGQ